MFWLTAPLSVYAQGSALVLEQRYADRYDLAPSAAVWKNRFPPLGSGTNDGRIHFEQLIAPPPSNMKSSDFLIGKEVARQLIGHRGFTDRVVDPGYYETDSLSTSDSNTPWIDRDALRTDACANSVPAYLAAADAMEAAFSSRLNPAWSAPFWTLVRTGHLREQLTNTVKAYDLARQSFANNCLSKTELGLDPAEKVALSLAIGFFRDSTGTYCTGARVAKDLVLTAGHCFYDTLREWLPNRDPRKSKFHLAFNGSAYEFRVFPCPGALMGEICPPRDSFANNDNVLVQLVPTSEQALPTQATIEFGAPKENERLVLVGYASEFHGADMVDPALYVGTAKGVSGCLVKRTDDGCIKHGCQARGGFSGAPLVRASSSGKLTLVGIHLGADSSEVDGGLCNQVRLQGNLGFAISPSIVSVIASQSR